MGIGRKVNTVMGWKAMGCSFGQPDEERPLVTLSRELLK